MRKYWNGSNAPLAKSCFVWGKDVLLNLLLIDKGFDKLRYFNMNKSWWCWKKSKVYNLMCWLNILCAWEMKFCLLLDLKFVVDYVLGGMMAYSMLVWDKNSKFILLPRWPNLSFCMGVSFLSLMMSNDNELVCMCYCESYVCFW